MKRTIEITIETEQVLQIHSPGNQRGWCRDCGRETDIATIDPARLGTRWNLEMMRKQLQLQGWHTSLEPDGALRVCLHSAPKESAGVETALRLMGKPQEPPR